MPPFLALCSKNAPTQIRMRSDVRNMFFFSVVMAQHEKCFAGSVLQGFYFLDWIAAVQLRMLRESNLNHPHTLQHSWSTALLP